MRQLARTVVRLNVETKSYHAFIDAVWTDLMRSQQLSRLDYVHHLVYLYGFDAPLESALAYTHHLDSHFDVQRYARAGLIAQDMLELGVKPDEIANVRQCMIAPFASIYEACGWLYLHQRSMLLHDAVRAVVLERLPEVAHATSYLRAHHGRAGATWEAFGEALDRIARTPLLEDRIIAAAHDAFRTASAWFGRERQQPARASAKQDQAT